MVGILLKGGDTTEKDVGVLAIRPDILFRVAAIE